MSEPIHVYPLRDTVQHVTDGTDCPCKPVVEPVKRDDGSYGWLVKHKRRI